MLYGIHKWMQWSCVYSFYSATFCLAYSFPYNFSFSTLYATQNSAMYSICMRRENKNHFYGNHSRMCIFNLNSLFVNINFGVFRRWFIIVLSSSFYNSIFIHVFINNNGISLQRATENSIRTKAPRWFPNSSSAYDCDHVRQITLPLNFALSQQQWKCDEKKETTNKRKMLRANKQTIKWQKEANT